MNLTKISQAAGVRYLLATVATGDTPTPTGNSQGATSPMHAYYVATGTPPGVWLGAGAEAAGIPPGMVVTADAATALFSQYQHPLTGAPLGGHRRLHTGRDGANAPVSVTAVAGYDLTFRVPKSVSALFAIADAGVREQVFAAHHQAIAQTLAWLEREVVRTRSGRGGVVATPVRGLIGARYDHWDNRNGDPHLQWSR